MRTAQQTANEIGAALRDLETDIGTAGNASMTQKVGVLHELLSQGLVDHLPELDWHEAAGLSGGRPATNAKGEVHTNAGGKHPPAPTDG